MSLSVEHDNPDENDKEHQLEHILSENMRMLDDTKDSEEYGYYLNVSPDDDDMLHKQEHQAFIDSNKLKPQAKSKMQDHIRKHDTQYKEKERMGLISSDSNSDVQPKQESPKSVRYVNQPA